MEEVEQTGQPDSTSGMDALLDRMVPGEDENQQDTQEQGGEQAGEQTQDAVEQTDETLPALEEVEWEGAKYQLPPNLKSALMRQQDYTQKTQEISERARMVALQTQRHQIETQFTQSVEPEMRTLSEYEAAIRQYENVNWGSLDTDTLVKTKHNLDLLRESRDQVKEKLAGKRQEFDQKMQGIQQESMRRANEILTRSIPKWGPEVQKELAAYGQSEGLTDVELNSITDHRLIKMMHKASQWEKLQAGKSIATKRASSATPMLKPGATKPMGSAQAQLSDALKQLHQAKDPAKKKEMFGKAMDLKLDRMFK
jgi:hypothetical protein